MIRQPERSGDGEPVPPKGGKEMKPEEYFCAALFPVVLFFLCATFWFLFFGEMWRATGCSFGFWFASFIIFAIRKQIGK